MELQDLNFTKSKLNTLNSNGINTVEDLLYSFPKKYYFFNEITELKDIANLRSLMYQKKPFVYSVKEEIAIIGNMISIDKNYNSSNNKSSIKIKIKESSSGDIVYVTLIGQYRLFDYYSQMLHEDVIIGGLLTYTNNPNGFKGYSMLNPVLISENIEWNKRIIPVYKKYKGISDKFYTEALKAAISAYKINPSFIPPVLYNSNSVCENLGSLLNLIHFPKSKEDIEKAKRQVRFEKMLYFQSCVLVNSDKKATNVKLYKREIVDSFIKSLPYELTKDQRNAVDSLFEDYSSGFCSSALIQGDVGCGKTIIAACLMMMMAENGFQSVLVAPTLILAKQHYEQIKEYGDRYGFKTVYLGADLKSKEKKEVLNSIKSGEALFIVGTHSCFSKDVCYSNLGLSITDEEHKFGVAQRAKIKERNANNLIHIVSMSATPIPRTIACSLYGNNLRVLTIKTLPQGRLPIKTTICRRSQNPGIFKFLYSELNKGNQVYVVCPLIDKADEESIMSNVPSIEETGAIYKNEFEPKYKVEIITGKTDKKEQEAAKLRFQKNESQILIATTVIEVGINVPNATVIVITGAERFGLATSHQLRVRVGRGNKQSYCILQTSTDDKQSANLNILCNETDGYEIAKEDLKNRGTGNLLGNEQSGKNKYIDMIISYPEMHKFVGNLVAKKYEEDTSLITDYIENYERRFTF